MALVTAMLANALEDRYRHALQTITGSGPAWVLTVFRWSVVQLVALADVLGISYEALNVWLFVVLLPGALLGSLALNVYLVRRVRRRTGGASAGRGIWLGLVLACGLQLTLGAQAPTRTVTRAGVFRIVQDVRPGQTALDEPVTRVQVFRGGVPVLATSARALLPGLSVHPATGRDVTGDGEPDVVLRAWAGGNHSGDDLYVYAGTPRGLERVGHLDGYGCLTRLADLDADGVSELMTCDPDGFDVPSAPADCPEVARPRPTVIYRFAPDRQRYQLATPAYRTRRARALRRAARTAVQAFRATHAPDTFTACAAWSAALDLLYAGDRVRAEQTLATLHARSEAQRRFRDDLWALLRRRRAYLPRLDADAPLLPR